jgi:hypothetical protein
MFQFKHNKIILFVSLIAFAAVTHLERQRAHGGLVTSAARETAEVILKKFGRGVAGETVEEVSKTTAKALARYGDSAAPFLKQTGHDGLRVLKEAGEQAPDIIKLHARAGDNALWIISRPKNLAIFLKHGDNAADALIKHGGIARTLIGKYGDDGARAMTAISRQNAQRLSIATSKGLLTKTSRSQELLGVISKHGDAAMDFVWRNKGALATTAVLGTFLADPETYIKGAKTLVVDPVLAPMARNTNWTLIVSLVLAIAFGPFILSQVLKMRASWKISDLAKQQLVDST